MVLVDLLRASTKDQLFQFNGQLDEQTDGVAIGSPLGLANVFMGSIEETLFLEGKMPHFTRGTLTTHKLYCLTQHQQLLFFKFSTTATHQWIFTTETENNGLFTFLGIQLLNRVPEILRPGLLLHYQSHIYEDFWKPSLTVHIAYRVGHNFLKNVTVW